MPKGLTSKRGIGWTFISSRLALAFATVLLLSAVVGVVALRQLETVSDAGQRVQSVTMPKLAALHEIDFASNSHILLAERRIGARDFREIADIERQLEAVEVDYFREIRKFSALPVGAREQEILKDLENSWRARAEALSRVNAEFEQGNLTLGRALFNSGVRDQATFAKQAIFELHSIAEEEALAMSALSDEQYNTARLVTILAVLCSLTAAVIAMVWAARNISNPLLQISADMMRISEGDAENPATKAKGQANEIHILSDAALKFRDAVTEARGLAKDIDTQRALLDATVRNMPVGLCVFDNDRRLVVTNPAFGDLFSFPDVIAQLGTPQGLVLQHIASKIEATDDDAHALLSELANNSSSKVSKVSKSGNWDLTGGRCVSTLIAPTTDGWMIIAEDITERMRAVAERDKNRARLETSFEASTDAFVIVEPDGTLFFSNGSNERFFPTKGLNWRVGSTFQDNWDEFRQVMATKAKYNIELPEKVDFEELAALPSSMEVTHPDGRTFLVRGDKMADGATILAASDITWMKEAGSLLEQRLAAIEAAQEGIAIADAQGALVYLNGAAQRMMGFESSALALGATWVDTYGGIMLPDSQEPFDLLVSREDPEQGTRTHEVTVSPLANGGAVIVIRDVTDRLEIEAREAELKQALVRAQRQEAVSQMAAGIAHDFNNVLAAISGSATLITMTSDTPASVQDSAERICSATAQATRLVNQLLDFGGFEPETSTFDLGSALKDFQSLIEGTLPKGVSFETEITSLPLVMRGDPNELKQAVLNLVLNARDAIGDEAGTIKIVADRYETAEAEPVLSGVLPAGLTFARVTVVDNGKGMPQEIVEKALQAYFTTKGRMGTGLGLAVAAMNLNAIGGGIDISSEEGTGTIVTMYWPCHTWSDEADDFTQTHDGGPDLTGLNIMVIEDELDVAEVLQNYLEKFGADVAVASTPFEAVEAIELDRGLWSAVVTDYDMPGMTGGDVAEKVSQIAPDLPIFVVTALARRLSDPRVAPGKVRAIFSKPADLDKLSRAIYDHCHSEELRADA